MRAVTSWFILAELGAGIGDARISEPASSGYHLPTTFPLPFSSKLSDHNGSTPKSSSDISLGITNVTVASGLRNANPSFHLLIPASETNANLCKTILSAFILNYPPPTLINFGKTFSGESWDNGTHTGKIRGIYNFLMDEKQVDDQDLVLVIDGYDVWFQLPPEVMIRRYHSIVRSAGERLRKKYGMVTHEKPWEGGQTERTSRYAQTVIYAADKLCWPNAAEDPACAAVPFSTLPKNSYGADTDKDSHGFLNRPKYLNSGTVIGPVADLRAIFGYAVDKVEKYNRGDLGDQFVFNEIFGEQEHQRETMRRSSLSAGGRWLEWLSDALGTWKMSSNVTTNNFTIIPGQRYEFGLGLDYESQLFQTLTHSHGDIDYLYYNDTDTLAHVQEKHHIPMAHTLSLPLDIQRAITPILTQPSRQTEGLGTSPITPHLDSIPTNLTWSNIPLATNPHVPSIPAVLHFNGDKSYLSTWWTKMWYQPYARALLRRYMRSPKEPIPAQAAGVESDSWWDMRGGKGGVWTDTAQWMEWAEVCKGYDEDVFGDERGVWGQEEGIRR
ncbi:MAG: hypothetical protein M1830_007058, partial [Pleopsidium flavum]